MIQEFTDIFPPELRVATINYAHTILIYVKRRSDINLETTGNLVEEYFRLFKQVPKDTQFYYYEPFSGIVATLLHYARLEESCYKSSYYEKDRAKVIELLKKRLYDFEQESNKEVHKWLIEVRKGTWKPPVEEEIEEEIEEETGEEI